MVIQAPPPCPGNWEYNHVLDYQAVLTARTVQVLLSIRRSSSEAKLATSADTRSLHGPYFIGLTPAHFDYYAGNYRGTSGLRCLSDYEIGIGGDARVGHTSATIPMEMDSFASRMTNGILLLDVQLAANAPFNNDAMKLSTLVRVVAALFVEFLEIHPYANGNGHMARFILLALLSRRNCYPFREWNIDPRPSDPPYTNLIKRYRNGERLPLELFILQSVRQET